MLHISGKQTNLNGDAGYLQLIEIICLAWCMLVSVVCLVLTDRQDVCCSLNSCPSLFVSLHPKRTGLELPSHVVGETGYLPLWSVMRICIVDL